MQMRKLKQFGLVLSCILSLFASSFAMCVCSHQAEIAKPETAACSHHNHAEADQQGHISSQQTDKTDAGDQARGVSFSEAECCILPATLKTVATSETVKLEKHLAELSASIAAAPTVVQQDRAVETVFTKPPYLSDPFYNLSPGRAPPGL